LRSPSGKLREWDAYLRLLEYGHFLGQPEDVRVCVRKEWRTLGKSCAAVVRYRCAADWSPAERADRMSLVLAAI
jgi:hypothetical protein